MNQPLAIPLAPVTERDPKTLPAALGFGCHFTDRMFSQRYDRERGWHAPLIGPYAPLTLSPAAQVFHNGQMIFEGTKAYRRPDGAINLFRLDRNMQRFNASAERMGLPIVDVDFHRRAIEELVRLEHRWVPYQEHAALYIRPVIVASEAALAVRAPLECLHYIIMSPVAPYFAGGFAPISVLTSEDCVRAVRGGTGEAKTPGNYAASIAATEAALAAGYEQVLWLDGVERRFVDEVGAMNIAFVYRHTMLRTPSLSGAILHGVTRESILVLAQNLGLDTVEDKIDIHEVARDIETGEITEIFGMGTGAVVAPVTRLGFQGRDLVLNEGQAGPWARRLFDELTAIQYGRTADPYGWTHRIEVATSPT